jgi:hypothetical protein
MKLESQITNNHSSLIDNQSKRRSTTVENVRQIHPFYAKQTQFEGGPNEHKHYCSNEIRNFRHFDGPKNKAKTNPIKANSNPIQSQFKPKQTQFKANQTQFPCSARMRKFSGMKEYA